MVVILPAPPLCTSGMQVEIERVSYPKIVYSCVISLFYLSTHSLGGRGQPQTPGFGTTHGKMGDLLSWKGTTT